jgi:hypothetical protein
MTVRSIGEIALGLARAKATRSFQPVRRNSHCASDCRSVRLWQPLGANNRDARRLIGARMKAAEFYNERNKHPGDREGPIGEIGVRLLRELYRIVDYKTGRLEPAIDTLCKRISRARATVVKYLARLKAHGFLDWVRRSEIVDNPGAGPQVRQITNAYGFGLPAAAAAWVKNILGNGPTPDCEMARREADAAEVEAMLDSAGTDELVDFYVADPKLAELLKGLGSSLFKNSASSISGQNPALDRI